MKNLEHQIKSQWYYVFWGVMAIAVVSGQIYVGLGYREMAKVSKENVISVTCLPNYQMTPKLNKTGEFE